MTVYQKSIELHRLLRGKLEVRGKIAPRSLEDLGLIYLPGVMEVCRQIMHDRSRVREMTGIANRVAIVTDGSALPGLGDVGPEAALPLVEAKALFFKEYADIDAFPLCLKSRDIDTFVETVVNLSPGFSAIDLEDLSAPRCFEIEGRLKEHLDIPVFDDDQHGTAIVLLAAIINACRVVEKRLDDLKIVINGAGSVGVALAKLLLAIGQDRYIGTSVREIIMCDSRGMIHQGRDFLNKFKLELALRTNRRRRHGTLADALINADIFVGASAGNVLSQDMIRSMKPDPVLICLANPVPEIEPESAKSAGAAVVATSMSHYPNCINTLLATPAIFRGALDAQAYEINNLMKLAAARALAESVSSPEAERLLPDMPSRELCLRLAEAVRNAALNTGVTCALP